MAVPRVGWITNLDAPYRRPVWRALGSLTDLRVMLLDVAVSSDDGANRGRDWDLATRQAETYAAAGVRTLRFRRGEARYYVAVGLPEVRHLDAVVLGGWESPAYWQVALRARLAGVPTVGFYESHAGSSAFPQGVVAAVRSRWFRSLDAVVVPGAASKASLLEMGVAEERVFEGFNAVDVEAIAAAAAANRTSSAGHRYIYVGQLIERKNVAGLLEAFAAVHASSDTLTFVGSGNQECALRALAARLGVEPHVRFAGYVAQSNLGRALGAADTLVLPSVVEVWGLVVNEALASGLHVVVSDRAGVTRSVEGMTGVWVSGTDVSELAAAMRASRERFSGPVSAPEVMAYTPERFARTFLDAIDAARGFSANTAATAGD